MASLVVASLKLITGILTNSLGILSEGLHSTVDLIAVSATYFAVKKADTPPDHDHQYGHGKAENLASLLESMLLLIIAAWIFYEAFERIWIKEAPIAINLISIVIILISIFIDTTRFRALSQASKKYRSSALEADALHFSTDLISTIVVLVGGVIVFFGIEFVDSIAAILVGIIVISISYRLGRKSVGILMDRAPFGVPQLIREEARKIEGIEKIDQIRVRESGSKIFVDLVVYIDKLLPLEAAHKIAETLSLRTMRAVPNSEVLIHTEPSSVATSSLITRIRAAASSIPEIKNIHSVRILEIEKKLYIDFHLEMEPSLPLTTAHSIASGLEMRIKDLDPLIQAVSSHIEPVDNGKYSGVLDNTLLESLNREICNIIKDIPEVIKISGLEVRKVNDKFRASLDCVFIKSTTVQSSHRIAERLEAVIRSNFKEIEKVTIHIEPEIE